MVVTVNHAVSHGLRLSLFILPFAIMVVPDTLSRPGGPTFELQFDFESDNVRCLVCQAVSDEFLIAINKVDPKKKTEGMSTFRLDGNGNQKKNVVRHDR